jgi:hypothetical protein
MSMGGSSLIFSVASMGLQVILPNSGDLRISPFLWIASRCFPRATKKIFTGESGFAEKV